MSPKWPTLCQAECKTSTHRMGWCRSWSWTSGESQRSRQNFALDSCEERMTAGLHLAAISQMAFVSSPGHSLPIHAARKTHCFVLSARMMGGGTSNVVGHLQGWDLLWSTCTPNLKSPCSPTTQIWKAMKNVKIGVVWEAGVTQGHRQCHHLIEFIWLPINFNTNYASILYLFSSYGE